MTVTATPASGYSFTNWTENGSVVSASASYTFTSTANRTLVANFVVVTVITGVESDIAPRPNGNNLVNAGDVTVMGRIVAGLESNLSAAEFQRADCAPRSSQGNGIINADDLTQVARYVAGLDPQTPVGGPVAAPANVVAGNGTVARKNTTGTRRASLVNTTATPGGTVTAVVQMFAQGDENALSFSVSFDPARLNLISTSLGTDGTGASLVVNTNRAGSVAGSATVAFGNTPAPESVSDALGNDLACQFVDGVIAIGVGNPAAPVITAQPSSRIAAIGGSVTLSVSATGGGTYQWQRNGRDIPGANGSTLAINNPTVESAGLYSVTVGNSLGSVTSASATVAWFGYVSSQGGLTLAGPVGAQFRIEFADALGGVNPWQTLTTVSLPNSPYLFIGAQSAGKAQRFYRAVLLR